MVNRLNFQLALRSVSSVVAVLLVSACLGSSVEPAGETSLAGTWAFTGQQSTGTPASMSGTLTLISKSSSSFGGSLDVVETIIGAAQRRLAGPVTGRVVNGASVDFTLVLGTMERQHIGAVKADTIVGTWYELAASGGINAGGSFRAVRARN